MLLHVYACRRSFDSSVGLFPALAPCQGKSRGCQGYSRGCQGCPDAQRLGVLMCREVGSHQAAADA